MVVSIDDQGLIKGTDVSLRGIILPRGLPAEEFVINLRTRAEAIIKTLKSNEPDQIKEVLVEKINQYFNDELRSKPLLHVLVMRAARASVGSQKERGRENKN